jgi:hypothetical protein
MDKSGLIMHSETGIPVKVPVFRGGDENHKEIIMRSFIMHNKILTGLFNIIMREKSTEKHFLLVRLFFIGLQGFFNSRLFGIGLAPFVFPGITPRSMIWTFFYAVPGSLSGFLVSRFNPNTYAMIALPILVMAGRGIEYVPDPTIICRILCEHAAVFDNSQIKIKM